MLTEAKLALMTAFGLYMLDSESSSCASKMRAVAELYQDEMDVVLTAKRVAV